MQKKAILLVSFGTIYVDALKKSVENTENCFRTAFPGYEVRRAFSSQSVIEKLQEQTGIQVDGVETALKKLAAEGYAEVYIQPLYIVADKTYQHIREYVMKLAHSQERYFKTITIGRPLLFSLGLKNHPDDYEIVIEALMTQIPRLDGPKAVIFSCNGSNQLEYATLQLKLRDAGITNAFVYTSEGYPTLEGVIKQLHENKVEEVLLVPFVMVASEHFLNYIAGDNENSAKSQLEAAGCRVSVWGSGLGENPAIQAIYVQHLKDALLALKVRHGHNKTAVHGNV